MHLLLALSVVYYYTKNIRIYMIKNIFSITFVSAALLIGCPAVANANVSESIEFIDNDFQNIQIAVVGQSIIHVTGANGLNMEIYNVAGVCVKSIRIDGADRHLDLNLQKGCYIVKIGKIVRKISIK